MELNVFETLYIVIGTIVSLVTTGECVYNGYESGELLIWGVYVLGLVAIGLVHQDSLWGFIDFLSLFSMKSLSFFSCLSDSPFRRCEPLNA